MAKMSAHVRTLAPPRRYVASGRDCRIQIPPRTVLSQPVSVRMSAPLSAADAGGPLGAVAEPSGSEIFSPSIPSRMWVTRLCGFNDLETGRAPDPESNAGRVCI